MARSLATSNTGTFVFTPLLFWVCIKRYENILKRTDFLLWNEILIFITSKQLQIIIFLRDIHIFQEQTTTILVKMEKVA